MLNPRAQRKTILLQEPVIRGPGFSAIENDHNKIDQDDTSPMGEGLKMNRSFTLIALAVGVSGMTTAGRAQTGADTYKAKCQMCHAVDGSGSTPAGKAMKALPLNSPDLIKASDAQLIAATTDGKGKMPAYKAKLSAPEIKDTITYIRTLQK
jgi:cytochrome c6